MEVAVGVAVLAAVMLVAVAIGKYQGKQPPPVRPIRIPKPKTDWSAGSRQTHSNGGDSGGDTPHFTDGDTGGDGGGCGGGD